MIKTKWVNFNDEIPISIPKNENKMEYFNSNTCQICILIDLLSQNEKFQYNRNIREFSWTVVAKICYTNIEK